MLPYALVTDFIQMKDLGPKRGEFSASDALTAVGRDKIDVYLDRATRFIQRFTRRDFYPWVETRSYAVPHQYFDLRMRRYPAAHLKLDNDLLETIVVNNGVNDLTPTTDYFLLENNIYPKTLVAVKFPHYWGGMYGGTTLSRRYDEPLITITGFWGYADYRYPGDYWIDTLELLTIDLTASATTFIVGDADALDDMGKVRFQAGYLLRIGNELLEVTGVTGDTITVKRGVRGSTAAIHEADAPITRWRVIEDIVEACLQIAKIWREADLAAGSRIGVSELSVGAELGIPADMIQVIKMYQRSLIFG